MKYAFLACFLLIVFSCGKSGKTTKPERKDLTQAVYASGKIYPQNDYKVYSKLPGYVEKIHVHIGDTVRVGQSLITIKSEVSELNVNSAKNLLDLANKNADENSSLMNALKQDVASAKAKYQLDSLNYTRFQSLLKENATSKNQFDQAKTQSEISGRNYMKAISNLNATRDRVRTELENAQIQYAAQVSNKSDYTLISTVSGKIYDIVPKVGELINAQTALLEIGDRNHYEVELSVDETDVALIKRGQKIMYSIDAYTDKFYEGVVEEAYPRINLTNKTSKVMATISIDPQTIVYSAMSVEANIIIAEKKKVLVIPREFLIEGKKVKLKDGEKLIEIKKGAESLEFIEILSGLDEHTEIIKQ